jgi:hypothetical protein
MAEEKMPINGSRCSLQAWLENHAKTDNNFRRDFLSSAPATLEKLVGKRIPAGLKVLAFEESPQTLYLVRRFYGAMEPFEPETGQSQLLSRSIHALTLDDETFWEQIKGDPKRILAERLALQLAAQIKTHVLEEDEDTVYLILHHDEHYKTWTPPPEVMQKVQIKLGQPVRPTPPPPPIHKNPGKP